MIRLHRSLVVPDVLTTEGLARRRAHEAEVDADHGSYAAGEVTLDFDRSVYGHASVKRELIAMQHGKCAFCEAKPLPVSDGDVEHFRPKGGARQAAAEPMLRPGYYWLAYEWTNLLFACERCNRREKKNLFPLVDPARRATSSRDSIDDEAPIFIDPSTENPEEYVSYREHVPVAIDGNERGERTIDGLGLRRVELCADREEHLELMRRLHEVASHPDVPRALRVSAHNSLVKHLAADAKYALMCRAAVDAWGGLPDAAVTSGV